jgi:hypothetical protein
MSLSASIRGENLSLISKNRIRHLGFNQPIAPRMCPDEAGTRKDFCAVVFCGHCLKTTASISASKTLCDNGLNSVDIPGGAPGKKALTLMAATVLFIVSDGVVPRSRDEAQTRCSRAPDRSSEPYCSARGP